MRNVSFYKERNGNGKLHLYLDYCYVLLASVALYLFYLMLHIFSLFKIKFSSLTCLKYDFK